MCRAMFKGGFLDLGWLIWLKQEVMTYQSNVKCYFDFLFPETILQARGKLLHEPSDFVLINERSQNCSLAEK